MDSWAQNAPDILLLPIAHKAPPNCNTTPLPRTSASTTENKVTTPLIERIPFGPPQSRPMSVIPKDPNVETGALRRIPHLYHQRHRHRHRNIHFCTKLQNLHHKPHKLLDSDMTLSRYGQLERNCLPDLRIDMTFRPHHELSILSLACTTCNSNLASNQESFIPVVIGDLFLGHIPSPSYVWASKSDRLFDLYMTMEGVEITLMYYGLLGE
ncbi:hypothetical protein K504DRAFT_508216 [Pleomassaria siparia CBS 279.74]|uniref:Uncharacterized protein n=1 Tax=Pleomassaria siparia CBS 279.74 TaxID=1314801 RepID=A0A6G1JSW7_9PLEO|nr:hypothetical protein K504DRAFT_508216 [Pleomassaria siparia CBS 279.74]